MFQNIATILYIAAIFAPCFFNFSSDESEVESETANVIERNIIKLTFADE